MTVKQKKGIRAAVLVFLLLLVAIGTYDSRHGYLAALAESRGSTSDGNVDLGNTRSGVLADSPVSPGTSPEPVKAEVIEEPGKTLPEERDLKVEEPVEAEEDIRAVEYVPAPVNVEPAPVPREQTPWKPTTPEPWGSTGDDPPTVTYPDPVRGPEPGPDTDPGPIHDFKPDPGTGHGPGVTGDRNKGHGNDEDGYDEDNPGRGHREGLESSRGRGGRGGSGGSGGRGGSGGHGGSKGKR